MRITGRLGSTHQAASPATLPEHLHILDDTPVRFDCMDSLRCGAAEGAPERTVPAGSTPLVTKQQHGPRRPAAAVVRPALPSACLHCLLEADAAILCRVVV